MAGVLKFWHRWNWAVHCAVWLTLGTAIVVTYRDVLAQNTKDINQLQQQHNDEHMEVRMVKQEQITQDIGQSLQEIKTVQGKIFDRLNQIVDKRP